ncbi:MAG: DUF4118 domain-containing protein [Rhodocyclaceae bacterium]|nr:DUF4118 domain-containing protein [Rhodocyclaceae bacterium]
MTTPDPMFNAPAQPTRLILALLLPFIACGVQWLLWAGWIKPYVWFLFFPAAFFSAWLGGLRAGIASTVIGALLVWFVFIPPAFSFELENLSSGFSILMFVAMGSLFAVLFERLTQAKRRTEEALAATEKANAQLSAANRELDSFAYAVAHDLRAPLRAMSGFSQALVEDYGDRLDGEAKTWLDQIGIASRKMGELIDGILVLSRSALGELRVDAIDLSSLATRQLEDLARGDPDRRVATEVDAGLDAHGDARMIETVMENLLENAWKYTGRAAEPRIRVQAGKVGGKAGFCVSDNGAGFDRAHAERLFKPFQRLHRQDEFPGIGIGLATVQRIIHRRHPRRNRPAARLS